jgi:hypothetical protein
MKEKKFRILEKCLLTTNLVLSALIIIAKLTILLSGHNKDLYELNGQMIPIWSEKVKLFSSIELFFAVTMLVSTVMYWKKFRYTSRFILMAIIFFVMISLYETIRFVEEFGTDNFSASAVRFLVFWLIWFATNYVFFDRNERKTESPRIH